MTATLNASTSNGVILTSDTSGNLAIQANGTTVATVQSTGLNLASTGLVFSDSTTQTSGSGVAKAWAQFTCTSGGTLTVNASYNISSITRNSAGQYTVSFTTSLADNKYAVAGGASGPNSGNVYGLIFSPFTISSVPYYQAPTTSSFVFATLYSPTTAGSGLDPQYASFAVFR